MHSISRTRSPPVSQPARRKAWQLGATPASRHAKAAIKYNTGGWVGVGNNMVAAAYRLEPVLAYYTCLAEIQTVTSRQEPLTAGLTYHVPPPCTTVLTHRTQEHPVHPA